MLAIQQRGGTRFISYQLQDILVKTLEGTYLLDFGCFFQHGK